MTTAMRFQTITGSEPIRSPYQIHSIWKQPMIPAILGFMP